ncbi:MAG: NUDIX domain-containing protein [Anaerolineae bacterium]
MMNSKFELDPQLNNLLQQITAACQPYWKFRDNHIHIPESTRFAKMLLAAYPQADPEIVLPAILLHDNGYANVPPDTLFSGLKDAPIGFAADITPLHEIEGAKIAREILTSLDFSPAKTNQVCEIIDGHDSRNESLSLEDSLVKDADKLWRYTVIAAEVAGRGWMKLSHEKFNAYVSTRIDQWMFTEAAKEIARATTADTQSQLRHPPEGTAFMLIKDGKLLVEKRRADKKLLPNAISIPGGHNDPGESAEETLVRELEEELGLKADSYKFVCTLMHFDREVRKLHYFAVESWSGEMVMEEAAELHWIDLDDLDALDIEVDRIAVLEFKRIYQ